MLPQAQKDIRRALRGLDQKLLGEIALGARAALGLDSKGEISGKDPNTCDLFVRAVEKHGLSTLFGPEKPVEVGSLQDFLTDMSTEEMRRRYLFMGLDKSGVCTCGGNDRSVMKRLILDEVYMAGFESLLATFPESVLSAWCEGTPDKFFDKHHCIRKIMARVFNLDFDMPQNETEGGSNEEQEDLESPSEELPPPLKLVKTDETDELNNKS